MAEALIIIGYVVLAALIVFLSIKLSNYVDMLDKSTKISGAVLGGVLLAAVTSLPELFTSLTAVVGVGKTDYVIGNILGSNIFDIAVLALLTVIFVRTYQKRRLASCQYWQIGSLIGLYLVTAVALFLPQGVKKYFVLGGWFNVLSLLILAIYVFSIFKLDKTETKEDEEVKVPLSVRQLLIRFSLAAVFLIGASIGVTYLSDLIVERFAINVTAAGALLLGVMTSLPEVISTFNLFWRKNVNAGTGNMIGSAVFNYIIIALSELLSFKSTVFNRNGEATKLLIFGLLAVICLLASIIVKKMADPKIGALENGAKKAVFAAGAVEIVLGLASFSCYLLYLLLPASAFTF